MVIKKRRIYDADFESVEKVGEKVTEKVIGRIRRIFWGNVPKSYSLQKMKSMIYIQAEYTEEMYLKHTENLENV
jgi:hypothetical protein